MKKLLLFLLALLIILVATGFQHQGFNQGMDMGLGSGERSVSTDHKLFIDGASGHYLLIDGANHYLKIDGV